VILGVLACFLMMCSNEKVTVVLLIFSLLKSSKTGDMIVKLISGQLALFSTSLLLQKCLIVYKNMNFIQMKA